MYNCFNKTGLNKMYNIDTEPIISAIIPVYNSEKTIYNAICSIQNQNFTNFEIILIDDFSNDNSSEIIKNLKKIDNRINIISNKKNMGSLYSRSIGVLYSKGEFIMALDNDDMFFSHDIFYFVLKFARDFDFDIVGFRAFMTYDYKDNNSKIDDLYNYKEFPCCSIVYQPQLSTWMLNKKNSYYIHDVTIWAKCIKKSIYKEATIKLGSKRYSMFVSWAEDTIINFIIFNCAKSFIFINKYGIIHLVNNSTASFSMNNDIKLFGEIFLVDVLYDFSKNNSDKNYALMTAYNIKNKFENLFANDTNIIYFKSILNKFLKSQYLSFEVKNKIIIDFKNFLF